MKWRFWVNASNCNFPTIKSPDYAKTTDLSKNGLEVIPLKLFYCQTFFETWRNEHSWYEHYNNAIKIWGHRLVYVSAGSWIEMGYFYWLCVKSLNHLRTELNLGYLKGTKFCLESKASFIDISNIASFKAFLIAWLGKNCTF